MLPPGLQQRGGAGRRNGLHLGRRERQPLVAGSVATPGGQALGDAGGYYNRGLWLASDGSQGRQPLSSRVHQSEQSNRTFKAPPAGYAGGGGGAGGITRRGTLLSTPLSSIMGPWASVAPQAFRSGGYKWLTVYANLCTVLNNRPFHTLFFPSVQVIAK